MPLNMDFHAKWNATQNGLSLKMECHSNVILLKMECHLKWNFTQNGMSFKM